MLLRNMSKVFLILIVFIALELCLARRGFRHRRPHRRPWHHSGESYDDDDGFYGRHHPRRPWWERYVQFTVISVNFSHYAFCVSCVTCISFFFNKETSTNLKCLLLQQEQLLKEFSASKIRADFVPFRFFNPV